MQVLALGSGQLAQMLALSAKPLGIGVMAYDVNNGKVFDAISNYPLDLTFEQAVAQAGVITAEFEHLPESVLTNPNVQAKLHPNADAIRVGGNRLTEKSLLDKLDIASAPYCVINANESQYSLEDARQALGGKVVIKAAGSGYDGKGQWRATKAEEVPVVWPECADYLANNPESVLIVEAFVDFIREVSVVGVRSKSGEVKVYPIVENLHHKGVLHITIAPALDLTEAYSKAAVELFTKIVNELDYVGVLAVELFDCGDQMLVNELAPRVHNSGHWSQNGARTSQFENHIRAVCGLPLGSTQAKGVSCMVNALGVERIETECLSIPDLAVHWYGKSLRPGRKMGHINLNAQDYLALSAHMTSLSQILPVEHYPELQNATDELIAQVK